MPAREKRPSVKRRGVIAALGGRRGNAMYLGSLAGDFGAAPPPLGHVIDFWSSSLYYVPIDFCT